MPAAPARLFGLLAAPCVVFGATVNIRLAAVNTFRWMK